MQDTAPAIDAETANHVLAHFGHDGYQPGSFTEQLITTIAMADMENSARLAAAYPELVGAVLIAKYDENGIAYLQGIARGEVAA